MKESAKTFILCKLEEVVKNLSNLKIIYKFDFLSNEHLIEVLPLSEYISNQEYQNIESELIFGFIKKFPFDSIVFFSEDDRIDIVDPDRIIIGTDYQEEIEQSEYSESQLFNIYVDSKLLISNFDDELINTADPIKNFYADIELQLKQSKVIDYPEFKEYLEVTNFLESSIFNEDADKVWSLDKESKDIDDNTCTTYGVCNNFALAA